MGAPGDDKKYFKKYPLPKIYARMVSIKILLMYLKDRFSQGLHGCCLTTANVFVIFVQFLNKYISHDMVYELQLQI